MISQRSVGRLQRLLQTLFYRPPQTIPLLSWPEFRTQLYEDGVDHRLLDHLEQEYGQKPSRFLPAIHDGTIPANILRNYAGKPESWDKGKGQELLKVMAEVALRRGLTLPSHLPEVIAVARNLEASLELDGYAFMAGELVPSTMKGMNLEREDDYLVRLIRSLAPPNLEYVLHHHDEADSTFVNGNWGSASAETRNFFVALLRGLRELATTRGGIAAFTFGNDSGLIENYQKIGLLTAEEKEAMLKLWVLLSYSGPHVGIQDDARARLIRLLVLGLAQWLCLKFAAWEKNAFQPL